MREAMKVDEQFGIHSLPPPRRVTPPADAFQDTMAQTSSRPRRDSYVLPDLGLTGDGSLRDSDGDDDADETPPVGGGGRKRKSSVGSLAPYLSDGER